MTGGAGIGKTHFLNILYQAFHRHFQEDDLPLDNPTVILSAQAALAATHIFGTTIHKCLGFHRASDNPFILTPIFRDRLSSLQAKYAHLQCMFIDEVSLVSADFFCAIDRRLREIKNSTQPFGGIWMILVGDFYQLNPVGKSAKMIFQKPSDNVCSEYACDL